MPLFIIDHTLSITALTELAKERFGDLVKAVVDVENGAMAIGSELHVDAEQLLLQKGSRQQDLWGIISILTHLATWNGLWNLIR